MAAYQWPQCLHKDWTVKHAPFLSKIISCCKVISAQALLNHSLFRKLSRYIAIFFFNFHTEVSFGTCAFIPWHNLTSPWQRIWNTEKNQFIKDQKRWKKSLKTLFFKWKDQLSSGLNLTSCKESGDVLGLWSFMYRLIRTSATAPIPLDTFPTVI